MEPGKLLQGGPPVVPAARPRIQEAMSRSLRPGVPQPPSPGPRPKIYVDGVSASIVAERVKYLDENVRLVTESLRDFTKKALRPRFASLDDFRRRWNAAERKQAIVAELESGLS